MLCEYIYSSTQIRVHLVSHQNKDIHAKRNSFFFFKFTWLEKKVQICVEQLKNDKFRFDPSWCV